ncbi:MAG: alpha/beta hydrolase [Burkholderiales bacterium]|jgi:arylformamidase|nr:alpha/beta hydrolase [Burkholderiales bacterium]
MRYTTEFCEREYNARAAIPEHPQIFARWAEQAAAVRAARPCQLDLRYGAAAAETLDLFPAERTGAPLLVFIHGGYWRSLDKADFSWIAPPYVDHGAAVALVNYGLAPATPLEEIVRQVLRALAWLWRNGARLGFESNRIVVCGHSAGGHLTAMAMAVLWPVFAPDLPRDLVKGGLAVSGLYDLEPLLYAPFVNTDLGLDATRARRLSPIHLPPATDAPLATAVGALESAEFRRQNALIAQRWPQVFLRDVPMPGTNHLTVCDELANVASPLFDCALDLLRRY